MADRESPPVVLVTGASRGIGRAVAERLEQDGAWVHRAARGVDPGSRTHRVDLLQPAASEGLIERILSTDGRLDRVVHAPGDYLHGRLDELEVEELEHLFRSNVSTAMQLVSVARDAVRQAQGAWILFGCAGLNGQRARRESAAYGAVKSALLTLVRAMALEEAAFGVRVNMISPGLVPHDAAHATTVAAERLARIPTGEPTRPENVADVVAWALSDRARQVTGQNLEVSGGYAL